MKGFKPTGNGPKKGFSFSSKAGFSGSTGRTQQVRGYTRAVPKAKPKFAAGGVVGGTDGGSALVRRDKPVTGFDKEAGGKSPLRPGFAKGGLGQAFRDSAARTVGVAAPQRLSGGVAPQVRTPVVGRGYGSFGRRPLVR